MSITFNRTSMKELTIVILKYDNGNNDWLTCDGRPGEWCVAFHGACVRNTSDQIKQIINSIKLYQKKCH